MHWDIHATRNETIIRDPSGRVLGTVTYHYGGWCGEVTMGGSSVLWCAASVDRRAVTAALKARIASYEAEARADASQLKVLIEESIELRQDIAACDYVMELFDENKIKEVN